MTLQSCPSLFVNKTSLKLYETEGSQTREHMTVNLVLGNFIHSILVIVRNTKKMDKLIYSNYSSAKHYMEASKAKHEKTQLPSTLIRDNFVSGIHFEVQRE